MKRELGIARCGLACCLCSENNNCKGCNKETTKDFSWCETRKCSIEKNINHCYECSNSDCRKGMLNKIKPLAFTEFVRRYGLEELLNCLERNEKNGIIYHRQGIIGDYDDFNNIEDLILFIKTGKEYRKSILKAKKEDRKKMKKYNPKDRF